MDEGQTADIKFTVYSLQFTVTVYSLRFTIPGRALELRLPVPQPQLVSCIVQLSLKQTLSASVCLSLPLFASLSFRLPVCLSACLFVSLSVGYSLKAPHPQPHRQQQLPAWRLVNFKLSVHTPGAHREAGTTLWGQIARRAATN